MDPGEIYDEPEDSLDGVDPEDQTPLLNAFASFGANYTAHSKSYFNAVGSYDYYRHYQKNYVMEKVGIFTSSAQYYYPSNEAFAPVMNQGYVNRNGNYYGFHLPGDTVAERLASTLSVDDLSLIEENSSYQQHQFTAWSLGESYFASHAFTRVSANKYVCTLSSSFPDFIDIAAPTLNNEGYYMTFSKVSIEIEPKEDVALRIRLYASSTQRGKLQDRCLDETMKPNWYLLFSETEITSVGSTDFAPWPNA